MTPVLLRPCASSTVAGKLFAPGVVPPPTLVAKEKVLSPAVTSPFEASSKNACAAGPPMLVKSAVTVIPVLVGTTPGVTATFNKTAPPAATEAGVALPTPVGFVEETAELRGAGAPVTKSALLLSVSCAPLLRRKSAVVVVSVEAAAAPSKQLAPS